MQDDNTASFYDDNAPVYAGRRRRLPLERLNEFLAALPPHGAILELGCGGGHDSAYMRSKGYEVTPTDGSAGMAKEAEKLLGTAVRVMLAEELEAEDAYDGIWAEASLLHVPRATLPDVLQRIHRALKSGGVFHASFKEGSAEGHDAFGRYYNYPSPTWLTGLLHKGGWSTVSMAQAAGGGYDDQPTSWLYLKAQK